MELLQIMDCYYQSFWIGLSKQIPEMNSLVILKEKKKDLTRSYTEEDVDTRLTVQKAALIHKSQNVLAAV